MSTKRERALNNYKGHKGVSTVAHIEKNIKNAYPEAYKELTGKQYGNIMNVANFSYHEGKVSTKAELLDDVVFVNGKFYPIALLNKIETEDYILDDQYNREHGTNYHGTIVKFDGKEIARYPYSL